MSLRVLLYGLAILHLGPGLAFAVLAFGCDPVRPLLGVWCERSALGLFAGVTLAAWGVLGTGAALLAVLRRRRDSGAP